MPLVPCLLLLAVPALASATGLTPSSGPIASEGMPGPLGCDGTPTWEQPPDGVTSIAAQDDACYPFAAEVADDFVGAGDLVYGVGWWGTYWSGAPFSPDGFNIRVYADDGGVPGDLLREQYVTEYEEEAGDPFGFCANVHAFTPVDGVRYHVSVQAVLCDPPQYGWATGEGNGLEGHFRSEVFGYPEWVPTSEVFREPYELAFHLLGTGEPPFVRCCLPDGTCEFIPKTNCASEGGTEVDDCSVCGATPVGRMSFGRIKGLFR